MTPYGFLGWVSCVALVVLVGMIVRHGRRTWPAEPNYHLVAAFAFTNATLAIVRVDQHDLLSAGIHTTAGIIAAHHTQGCIDAS